MSEIQARPAHVHDGQVIVDLPDDHWAVLRKSIPRGKAQALRNALWAAGILPGTLQADFTGDQWQAWEEDWAQRIPIYTVSWSLKGEDGEPLPITREGVDEMSDSVYQQLTVRINRLMQGRNPEDAKSASADPVGMGEGHENGRGDASAVPVSLPTETDVVAPPGPSLSD